MVSLKIVPILALAMGLSTFALAGDKSAKADNSKADNTATAKVETAATPTQADAKANDEDGPFYYIVTNLVGGNYSLTSEPAPTGPSQCKGGPSPCEISSITNLGTSAPKTFVDGGAANGVTWLQSQPQL